MTGVGETTFAGDSASPLEAEAFLNGDTAAAAGLQGGAESIFTPIRASSAAAAASKKEGGGGGGGATTAAAAPPPASSSGRVAAPGVYSQTDIRLSEWVLKDSSVSRTAYLDVQTTLRRERVAFLREASTLRQALLRLEASARHSTGSGGGGGGFSKASAIKKVLTPAPPPPPPMPHHTTMTTTTTTITILGTPAASSRYPGADASPPPLMASASPTSSTAGPDAPAMTMMMMDASMSAARRPAPPPPPPHLHSSSSSSSVQQQQQQQQQQQFAALTAPASIVSAANMSVLMQMNDAAMALQAVQTIDLMEERRTADLTALREKMTAEMDDLVNQHRHEVADLRSEIELLRSESEAQHRAGTLERERLVQMMERSNFESISQLKNRIVILQQELEDARNHISNLQLEKETQGKELTRLKAEKIMQAAEHATKRIANSVAASENASNNINNNSAADHNKNALTPVAPSATVRLTGTTAALVSLAAVSIGRSSSSAANSPSRNGQHRRPLSSTTPQVEYHQEQALSARQWLRQQRQDIELAQVCAKLGSNNPMSVSAQRGALLWTKRKKQRLPQSICVASPSPLSGASPRWGNMGAASAAAAGGKGYAVDVVMKNDEIEL